MKRKEVPDSEESGYLLDVTPIKISRNNNKYFNAKLQTQFSTYDIVCFNSEKHSDYVAAEKSESPVKLENFKYSPSYSGKLDIQMTKSSNLKYVKSLNFSRRKLLPSASTSTSEETTSNPQITKIGNIDVTTTHIMYNITGKVLQFTSPDEVLTLYGQEKTKRDALVGDDTGCITVSLWENLINSVQVEKSFQFTNVSTRNVGNSIKLTTTTKTNILPVEDISAVSDNLIRVHNTKINGNVVQVQAIQKNKCPSCDKSIEDIDQFQKTVKCKFCNLKSRVDGLKKVLYTRINFKDSANSIHRLVAFKEPVSDFLTTQNKIELLNNMDELEDYLLDLGNLELTCAKDVITSISLQTSSAATTSL